MIPPPSVQDDTTLIELAGLAYAIPSQFWLTGGIGERDEPTRQCHHLIKILAWHAPAIGGVTCLAFADTDTGHVHAGDLTLCTLIPGATFNVIESVRALAHDWVRLGSTGDRELTALELGRYACLLLHAGIVEDADQAVELAVGNAAEVGLIRWERISRQVLAAYYDPSSIGHDPRGVREAADLGVYRGAPRLDPKSRMPEDRAYGQVLADFVRHYIGARAAATCGSRD